MNESRDQAAADIASALAPIGRRRFLRMGLWTAAGVSAVAAGGFALLRRSPRDALPMPAGLNWMTPQQHQLFSRLAQVLLPTQGTPLVPIERVPVVANVNAILGALAPAVREQLAMGFALFDNAAVAGHWHRFVDLPDEAALAYINDWVNADLMPKRAIGYALTKLTHTAYWMDSQTWPAVEFDGPVTKKWGLPSLGNQPLPN